VAINKTPQLNMRRSNISPNKIANTGVNPYTGEYLSAGEKKLLFKRNVSSANVFKKSGALVKTTPSTITPDINVTVLSKRVFVLENDVSFLAKTLNKEAELEKKAQKQYEKDVEKVEEKKLRSGEEKQLEKKITKGLISPVKAVGKKAGGVLGTLMELFMTLLGGWLTNQGLEAIRANAEGDIGKLESIAAEVGKTLLIVGGIFALLNGGILGIIGTIGAITAAIIAAPFKFAFRKLRELVTGKPKPPGGGKPGPGGGKPGAGGGAGGGSQLGGGISSSLGNQSGYKGGGTSSGPKANFNLDQQRQNLTRNNMMKDSGPKGPLDMIKRFIRGKLEQHRHVGKGKHIVKILDKAVSGLGWAAKLPGIKQVVGVIRSVIGFITNPRGVLGKIFGKIGGKLLLRALRPILAAKEVRDRALSGMSPAQSIIGSLFPLAGSIAGGALGGGIGAAGGPLAFWGALGGSFLGGMLGGQLTGVLDSFWSPNKESWDNFGPFKGLNEAVYDMQSKDDGFSKFLQTIFPYEGTEKYKKEKVSAPAAPAASTPEASVPEAMPAAQIASSSSSSMSAPGPVSSAGNTTVIYKKVGGSGGQMQGQPLKSGSATDVPLIASADPSNFYTMYSQLLYNVVG
jgi:hypothetical protein